MSPDLTVIFLTVNRLPTGWVEFHRKVLLEAIEDYPLITVSREPMDMPGVNLIQDGEIGASNIYYQMLRAAKLVTTPYLAIAEDDSLYPREHFATFRPQPNEFAYNMIRWAVLTWGKPTYFWSGRISNLTLVAPTELTVNALQARFDKYPNGIPAKYVGELGKYRVEKRIGVGMNKYVEFYTRNPVVNFNHKYAIDMLEVKQKKGMSHLRAYDIPYWGRAEELVRHFA